MRNETDKKYSNYEKDVLNKRWLYIFFMLLFLVLSFLSFLFIYKLTGSKTSFITLEIFSKKSIILLGILLVFYYIVEGIKICYILKALSVKIKFKSIIKLVFMNVFVSNVTPFALGGGILQIYFFHKKGVSVGIATAAAIIRSLLSLFFFFVAVPIIVMLNRGAINLFLQNNLLVLIVVLFAGYIAVGYLGYRMFYSPKMMKAVIYQLLNYLKVKRLISSEKSKKIERYFFKEIDRLSKSMKLFFKGQTQDVFMAVGYTLLQLVIFFMFPVVIIKGMGYSVPVLSVMASQIIVTFMTYFAPTPGASGVAEGGFSIIFSQFLQKKDILTATFMWRLFTKYLGFILGMIVFYWEMIKVRKR